MPPTQPPILMRCYDLLALSLEIIRSFPRDQKFLLGSRLQNLLSDLLETYIEAAYTSDQKLKKEKLHHANIQLEKLRFFLRLAFDKNFLSAGRYRDLSEKVQELGRMTGGWLKTLG